VTAVLEYINQPLEDEGKDAPIMLFSSHYSFQQFFNLTIMLNILLKIHN